MKKALSFLFILVMFTACGGITAAATPAPDEEVPQLTSVTFSNAVIDGSFSSDKNSYSLILDDPDVAPVIADYAPENLKVTAVYNYDETHHPTGITITAAKDNSMQYSTYFFSYANLNPYQVNDNNLLSSISCSYCELSPKINDNDTEYTLYVPSDLTTIELSVVAKDINAYCKYSGNITCAENQELSIPITVIASNGEQRQYKVNVSRLNKTVSQVKAEMADPDFKSIIDKEHFYEKDSFKFGISAAVIGLVLVIVFIKTAKRLTAKANDEEEEPFFDIELKSKPKDDSEEQ